MHLDIRQVWISCHNLEGARSKQVIDRFRNHFQAEGGWRKLWIYDGEVVLPPIGTQLREDMMYLVRSQVVVIQQPFTSKCLLDV